MADIADFYSSLFDFPACRTPGSPRPYFIASSARTGSTWLSLQMYNHVGFGLPLEYFNFDKMAIRKKRFGDVSLLEYTELIIKLRTDPFTNIFGFKCFANQAIAMMNTLPDLYTKIISQSYVIRLQRRNKLRQAVSMARALQTGRWFANRNEKFHPEYSYNTIAQCLKRIALEDCWWNNFLFSHKYGSTSIFYEDIVLDPHKEIMHIMSDIGLSDMGLRSTTNDLIARQSDDLNDHWVHRFQHDYESKQYIEDGYVPE